LNPDRTKHQTTSGRRQTSNPSYVHATSPNREQGTSEMWILDHCNSRDDRPFESSVPQQISPAYRQAEVDTISNWVMLTSGSTVETVVLNQVILKQSKTMNPHYVPSRKL
jgi:hypothetical protein